MEAKKKRGRNEKQTTWTRAWNETHLDRIYLTVPKGWKQAIQAHARQHGETVNGLLKRLLQAEMRLPDEEKGSNEKPEE